VPGPAPPRRRASRWARWYLVCAWSLVALGAVGLVVLWQARSLVDELSSGLKAAVVREAAPELGRAPAVPAVASLGDAGRSTVILAVGSDRRAGERGRGRSDTMLLIRIGRETVSMLSLPRDLRVRIPGRGSDKLNAAYAYGGMRLLIATVRENLGVRIDHFAHVDFGGFREVVDRLGGVYLPVDGRYLHRNDGTPQNNYADIDLLPGYQRLDHERALQFVRYRHGDSDFHRAARQQLFLREVGRQIQAGAGDLTALPGIARALARATTSDLSSLAETLELAHRLRSTPPDRINRVVLPGRSVMLGGVSYVVSTPAERRWALERWARPGARFAVQRRRALTAQRRGRAPGRARLIGDGGAGARLAARLRGVEACAPRGLPPGYRWGAQVPARSYTLDGHPAGALWATAGSGRSVLFMFTTWQRPPVLERPSATIRLAGQPVQLYYESGRLRMVAWRRGATRGWVTNTLRNELSDRAMIALARSCLRS
jgi:LCP family protein required for cell wall assembly